MFDTPGMNPYTKIPVSVIRCPEHKQLAREAAVKSIVLLKNANGVLPLKKNMRRLYVWYPGEQGGLAVADVIFGDASPSGRLPVTFPKSKDQLPPYADYSMVGRTYRYMTQEPLYPFGFGLSYTRFEYADLKLDAACVHKGDPVRVTATVKNFGPCQADEVVQLYLTDLEASVRVPISALKGFKRITLKPGQSRIVTFTITPEMMALINENGDTILDPGQFKITLGGCSPGTRGPTLGASNPAQAVFTVLQETREAFPI